MTSARREVNEQERALIAQEEDLLQRTRQAIMDATLDQPTQESSRARFLALRDEVAEANADDVPALVTQMELIKQQTAVGFGVHLPDLRVPYFGRMRLRSNGKSRDVLLGHETFVDLKAGLRIVDWRRAPIAQVFFRHREGESYDIELPRGRDSGVLETRTVLTFDDGTLARIDHTGGTLRRVDDGIWVVPVAETTPRFHGARGGSRARQLAGGLDGVTPTVTALLDQQQYAAMETADDGALLLLGAAGCGKTTVALHRLAMLHRRDPYRYPVDAMAVVVPSPGLERLTRLLLRELRLHGVEVFTFDDWVGQRARRVFKRLPKRECEAPPYRVVRFKRHPAVFVALEALVEAQGREAAADLDRLLQAEGALARRFDEVRGRHLAARISKLESWWTRGWRPEDKRAVRTHFNRARRGLEAKRDDLHALFGSEVLLERAVKASEGALRQGDVEDVARHTRIQFSASSEERYGHVDQDRLRALDGESLDAGTPDEDIGTIDVEDYAILLELQRRKAGLAGKHRGFAHLVVDEAQDLTSIELAALGGALKRDASVTVAGDAAQHIDQAACFTSWRAVLEDLRVPPAEPICLTTSYRCTRPVAEFGHHVLGHLAPAEPPDAPRDGPPVQRSSAVDLAHAALQVAEGLRDLLDREPAANVAVIARDKPAASYVHQVLEQSVEARLIVNGDFDFGPGVEVTEIAEVKGLEFDYVIIPDVVAGDYTSEDAARRAIHVAATRTIHQLWVVAIGRAPGFLPPVDEG